MNYSRILKSAALIQNESGEILLARKYGKTIWINIGGRIENGESPIQCLKREIEEETGCRVSSNYTPKFFLETPFTPAIDDPNCEVKIIWYKAKLEGIPQPKNEIEELKWVDPHDPNIELSPQIREFLIPKLISM